MNGHPHFAHRVQRPAQLVIQANTEKGVVHIETSPSSWMQFDPLTALEIGKRFIDSAIACGASKPDWYTP